jgi:hypothetical protein
MVADELRRQADDFIELSELAPLIARNPSERAPHSAVGGRREADDCGGVALPEPPIRLA